MRASLNPQAALRGSIYLTGDLEVAGQIGLGAAKTVVGSGATPALDFSKGSNLEWTPDHATPAPTAAGHYAGQVVLLKIITWGSASTITFNTGFKTPSTLVIGTTTGKFWTLLFVSDGTNLIEMFRSAAVTT